MILRNLILQTFKVKRYDCVHCKLVINPKNAKKIKKLKVILNIITSIMT